MLRHVASRELQLFEIEKDTFGTLTSRWCEAETERVFPLAQGHFKLDHCSFGKSNTKRGVESAGHVRVRVPA